MEDPYIYSLQNLLKQLQGYFPTLEILTALDVWDAILARYTHRVNNRKVGDWTLLRGEPDTVLIQVSHGELAFSYIQRLDILGDLRTLANNLLRLMTGPIGECPPGWVLMDGNFGRTRFRYHSPGIETIRQYFESRGWRISDEYSQVVWVLHRDEQVIVFTQRRYNIFRLESIELGLFYTGTLEQIWQYVCSIPLMCIFKYSQCYQKCQARLQCGKFARSGPKNPTITLSR